jgi:amino acid transporter
MNKDSKLRPNCLNFIELLAQNIALISPTMTAALIVPLMFSNTGNISWFSYALGTVMLLFVTFNLNQFARRSAGTGSMYSYTSLGLGPSAGTISGWCLVWAYTFIGLAGTTGFTIFAGQLLAATGTVLPPPVLFAICLSGCFALSYFDIKVSTIILLILEGVSVSLILILCMIVFAKHGLAVDSTQFTLKGVSLSSLGLGVVVAVFSLVGFESSTAFGEEAVNPTKTVPRSIIWSLILTGTFFVLVCYMEVMATHGYSKTLDQIDAPLSVISEIYKAPFLSLPLAAGAMCSFFALALSCMNAGSRVMMAMGRHGIFHSATSRTHSKHMTPHIALAVMGIVMFSVVTIARLCKMEVLDEFNDAGTMGAFGFIGAYTLITLAAPFFVKKHGEAKPKDWALCIAALVLLLIPAVGSVYPVPPAPVKYFPYVFLGYLAIGAIRVMTMRFGAPGRLAQISEDVHTEHIPGNLAVSPQK